MNKDLVERTRKTLLEIDQMVANINGYLAELHRQTEREIAELQRRTGVAPTNIVYPSKAASARTWPPTTTEDTRDPYLAGRQPRRDGDSYGSVALGTARGGAHGEKGEGLRKR